MNAPETEVVARGIVRGIVPTHRPEGSEGPLVSVRRGEQSRCPRCHGEDLSEAVPCPACGVLLHAECLTVGCVSFNCRIVGTRVGGALAHDNEDNFDAPAGEWSDWQDAPEGSAVEIHRRRTGYQHGPNPLVESSWRYAWPAPFDSPRHGPNPRVEQERYRWAHVSWHDTETLRVLSYRVERLEDGEAVQADVTVEDPEDPGEEGDVWALLNEERLTALYREDLAENIEEYVDSSWLADMAWEAFRDRETIDFADVRRQEIEARLDGEDVSTMAERIGYENVETDVSVSDALQEVLGFDVDAIGTEG